MSAANTIFLSARGGANKSKQNQINGYIYTLACSSCLVCGRVGVKQSKPCSLQGLAAIRGGV